MGRYTEELLRRMNMDDAVHVPLTAAQFKRIQQLQQAAAQIASTRDAVLSALIEGVVDQDFTGWKIDIRETELVLSPPPPVSNGTPIMDRTLPISQAELMSP